MSDPFQDAHRAKAREAAKAAEKKDHDDMIERATARGKTYSAKRPEPKPFIPSRPFWEI